MIVGQVDGAEGFSVGCSYNMEAEQQHGDYFSVPQSHLSLSALVESQDE